MIELKTFDKSRVNPVDDGVLYNALAGESGILTGCGLTEVGGAQVQIRDGYLILCGRVCKVSQEVLHANLSANGTQEGQLVAVIDLSNSENPIKLETRLPKGELMQGDINAGGTVYELEIATYTADELSVKSITTTANKIGLANKAALEAVSAELANKANISALGKPSGIATLDSSGKLAQMPTAADVGAVPSMLTDIIYVDQADPVPHYDNLNNYITPGQRVHIATVTTARSVDNCPEASPGIMEVAEYNHSVKTGQTLGIIQRYIATSGNTYTRIYTHQNGYWSNWASGALKPMQPYVSTQLTGSGYVYFACYGLDAGSYIFTACGNFNAGGSDLYRATYTAIIHISCDYNSAAKQIIARVSHAPLLISANFGDTSDEKFDVGFNNMVKTMPWSTWQSGGEPGKIYISAASSTSSSVSDWSCKLLKLI